MRWYMPSWNGDFRFEADALKGCELLIVSPTVSEQGALMQWAKIAEKKEWVTAATLASAIKAAVETKAPQTVSLTGAKVADAGAEMAKILKWKKAGILTAFAFADGRVTATEILPGKLIEKLGKGVSQDSLALAAEVEKAEKAGAKAAATVHRPTLSCPECSGKSEAARMPCDVLWDFLSPPQRQLWLSDRAVHAVGNLTGHLYRIAARDTAEAARRGRTTFDMDDMVILHNYAWDVPPEEEVLTVKLLIEHRENWLRVHGEVDPVTRATPGTIFDDPIARTPAEAMGPRVSWPL